jgi:DNA processing protein
MTQAKNPIPSEVLSTRAADPDERLAYIALGLIPGLGAQRLATLLSHFGSARQVIAASLDDLQAIERITPAAATAIRHPPLAEARKLAARALAKGHATLVPADADYPATLRSIPDPPVVLFTVGQRDLLRPPAVAIVGSRRHSRYGADVARQLGRAAAEAGIPVVSGMAKGLDAIAQTAALDAGGTTIGVLGTGADIIYPLENAPLFRRVEEAGLILTEHPPGDQGFRGAFPRRNRLISGLARALVVVEAAEASGTLLTVTSALEQGREVLVVPGPINSVTSKGTNRLLRDGATPLLAMDDMLAAFGAASQPGATQQRMPPRGDLSPDEARTLGVLSADGRDLDDVALAAGLPIGLVLGTLLGLELGGLVEQLPGNVYRRR